MPAVENVEWLNQNLLRAYPLHENSDMTPRLPSGVVASGLTVPTCLVTDFSFTLDFSAVTDATVPSLTGISHAGDGFSLELSLGTKLLATVTAKISDHTVNRSYLVTGVGDNADCRGWITLGDLRRAADELPEGVYRFQPGQVTFEVSTLRMAPRGVRSITAVGKYGLRTYAPLYGNVRIIAGSDMSVRNDGANNAIWLQAESGTGYERTGKCSCGTESHRTITRINGMTADEITIVGDGLCLDVTTRNTADKQEITLSDSCSTPCCGCSELNFIEAAVATLNRSNATLQDYARLLQTRLTELKANLETTKSNFEQYPT